MRRIDRALQSVDNKHRQENYVGPLASTSAGGHNANVNNLYNSQVRDAKTVMPYGISSRPLSGVKAQAVVNDNSDNVVVGVYDPKRPAVGVGELCLYSSGGCSIYLSSTGIISIVSGDSNIDVSKNKIDISRGKTQIQIKNNDIAIKSGDTGININSDGVTIDTEKTIGITAVGDITVKSDGNINMESAGDINMKCSNLVVNDETMIVP